MTRGFDGSGTNELFKEISDREAAEDYRRQRPDAEARKSGFLPMRDEEVEHWLTENSQLIREIARANAAEEADIDDLLEQYREILRTAPPGSPFDDVNARVILRRIVDDIERFCSDSGIPIRGGVVVGVEPKSGTDIHHANVPLTDVSIIAATIPFIAFCNLIARATARSLPHREVPGSPPEVSFNPDEVRAHLASNGEVRSEWSKLLAHYAMFGWPPPQNMATMPQGWQQVTRILLLRALELFAVAHEFGHHVGLHGAMTSSEDRADMLTEEHEADVFARIVSIGIGAADQPPNHFAITGVGGVLILGSLELVRRARALLTSREDQRDASHTDTHPPFLERIDVIGLVDQQLPERWKSIAPTMRQSFIGILEVVWELSEPQIRELVDAGKRYHSVAETGADWLPF